MNSQRNGLRVASVIFGLVALVHVFRLFKHAKVSFGSHVLPMEVSWIGIIIFGGLCFWMWRLSATR